MKGNILTSVDASAFFSNELLILVQNGDKKKDYGYISSKNRKDTMVNNFGMRYIIQLMIIPFLLLVCSVSGQDRDGKWKLVWEDHFEGNKLDTTKWSLIDISPERFNNASDWDRHMIKDERVYSVENGSLWLKGINNPGIANDSRPFLTGGVQSKGKFSFLYGKVEIRARKECAQGAWPALWMMPEESVYGGWPHSGEIDIMEHLNFDSIIYYTVHTRYTNVLKNTTNPPRGIGDIKADVTQWNIYGLEWHPDVLIWTLNGKETFRYPRVEGLDPEMRQWPFDQPFYFILSQQLGGSWVGKVDPEGLPVSFVIDFVKVYQQERAKSKEQRAKGKSRATK